jgi:hypothetical protein
MSFGWSKPGPFRSLLRWPGSADQLAACPAPPQPFISLTFETRPIPIDLVAASVFLSNLEVRWEDEEQSRGRQDVVHSVVQEGNAR